MSETGTIEVRESGRLGEIQGRRKWRVRIIGEGRGASGYYSREVLERDAPAAFPVGTKVNIDHPSDSEAYERPEGSLKVLAGAVVSTPEWSDLPEPGVYADVEIGEAWGPFVEQFHEIIGLSIRAQAIVSPEVNESGDYDIMGIVPWPTNSVDMVTVPGANGRFIEAFESFRDTITNVEPIKEASVDLNDIQKVITEAIAPLIEAQKEPETPEVAPVSETIKKIVEADIPADVKVRIAEAADANPGTNVDGLIENAKAIAEAVRAEIEAAQSIQENGEGDPDMRKGPKTGPLTLDDLKF